MPVAHTTAQKNAISSFQSVTNTDRTTAARVLRNHNWNVSQAVNAHFSGGNTNNPSSGQRNKLSSVFDKFRDEPKQSPDSLNMEGTQEYLGAIDVSLDDITMLVVSELVQCPQMGEINRESFIAGWSELNCETIDKQKAHMANLRKSLSDPASLPLFRRVYRHTFILSKPPDQKAMPLDVATVFWRMLFSSPSPVQWSTAKTPWLDWWIEFVETKWKKSVNKDMWEQTLKFAVETMKDESLRWWSEGESAWPGVIDEFILEAKQKKCGSRADEMEVE